MQPIPPSPPNRPSAPPPRSALGPGFIVGILALLAFVYLMDHAGKGEAAIFSGVDRRISGEDFRGTQCTAVFGGCKIDLRDARIEGSEAVLNANAVFGGVEVWIPEDWEVVHRNFALFGGVNDHTRRAPRGPGAKTLILEGAVVFGGIEIKN